jgi:hypothetical protein
MAKRRVGVLEAHEAPGVNTPRTACGRTVADYLIDHKYALRIGKRLIQMIRVKAHDAIRQAKAALKTLERAIERVLTGYDEGPMGRGMLVPFSRARNKMLAPEKLHYQIPSAGDVGMRRHNLWRVMEEDKSVLRSKKITVSSRSLFSQSGIQWAYYDWAVPETASA